MPYRVLHLSDLHFGEKHQFAQDGDPAGQRNLAAALRQALADAELPDSFDMIVLSGDVYTTVSQAERPVARLELQALQESFPDAAWVVVPGNHDLSWAEDVADDRLVFFNNLVRELWPGMALPRELPAVSVVERADGDKRLAFIALDSTRAEGPVQAGLGYVSDEQLDLVAPAIADAGVSSESHIIVAVLHHHLLAVSEVPELPKRPAPGEEEQRVITSVTLDAARTVSRLAAAGVSIVMLGHQHVAKLLSLYDADWDDRGPLHIASAGSCGFIGENMLRHFFVWEIEDDVARATSLQQPAGSAYDFGLGVTRALPLR